MKIRTILAAAAISMTLLTVVGCAVSRGQQTAGAYVDDSAITASVKTRMLENPDVAGTSITVETLNGTVMLSGFAKSQKEKAPPKASRGAWTALRPSRTRSPSARELSARERDASGNHQLERHMNWDRIEGNWKQVTGKVKVQWGKLTDDDIDVVAGRRDQLAGKIQERYGIAKDEAEKQLSAWESKADDSWFQ